MLHRKPTIGPDREQRLIRKNPPQKIEVLSPQPPEFRGPAEPLERKAVRLIEREDEPARQELDQLMQEVQPGDKPVIFQTLRKRLEQTEANEQVRGVIAGNIQRLAEKVEARAATHENARQDAMELRRMVDQRQLKSAIPAQPVQTAEQNPKTALEQIRETAVNAADWTKEKAQTVYKEVNSWSTGKKIAVGAGILGGVLAVRWLWKKLRGEKQESGDKQKEGSWLSRNWSVIPGLGLLALLGYGGYRLWEYLAPWLGNKDPNSQRNNKPGLMDPGGPLDPKTDNPLIPDVIEKPIETIADGTIRGLQTSRQILGGPAAALMDGVEAYRHIRANRQTYESDEAYVADIIWAAMNHGCHLVFTSTGALLYADSKLIPLSLHFGAVARRIIVDREWTVENGSDLVATWINGSLIYGTSIAALKAVGITHGAKIVQETMLWPIYAVKRGVLLPLERAGSLINPRGSARLAGMRRLNTFRGTASLRVDRWLTNPSAQGIANRLQFVRDMQDLLTRVGGNATAQNVQSLYTASYHKSLEELQKYLKKFPAGHLPKPLQQQFETMFGHMSIDTLTLDNLGDLAKHTDPQELLQSFIKKSQPSPPPRSPTSTPPEPGTAKAPPGNAPEGARVDPAHGAPQGPHVTPVTESSLDAAKRQAVEELADQPEFRATWDQLDEARRAEVTVQLKRLTPEEIRLLKQSPSGRKLMAGAVQSGSPAEVARMMAAAQEAGKLSRAGWMVIGVGGDVFGLWMAGCDWVANGRRIAQTANPELQALYREAYTVPIVEGALSTTGLAISGATMLFGVEGAVGALAAGAGAVMLPVGLAVAGFRYAHSYAEQVRERALETVSDLEKKPTERLLAEIAALSQDPAKSADRGLARDLILGESLDEQSRTDARSKRYEAYFRTFTALPFRPGETPAQHRNAQDKYVRSAMLYVHRLTAGRYTPVPPEELERALDYAELLLFGAVNGASVVETYLPSGQKVRLDLANAGTLTDFTQMKQFTEGYAAASEQFTFQKLCLEANGDARRAEELVRFSLRVPLTVYRSKLLALAPERAKAVEQYVNERMEGSIRNMVESLVAARPGGTPEWERRVSNQFLSFQEDARSARALLAEDPGQLFTVQNLRVAPPPPLADTGSGMMFSSS